MTLFEDDVKSLTFRNKTVKSMVRTRDNAIIYQMIPDVDYMTVIVQNLEQAPIINPYNHECAFYPPEDIMIDFGDGTEIEKYYDEGGYGGYFTHRYNSPGTYTVKIYGITKLDGGANELGYTYHGAPFGDIEDIISIIVPNSVTSLGKNAFSDCKGLTSVTIPDHITELGECCFSWCKGFSSMTIPPQITKLGVSCFEECDNLTSIVLPNNITELEENCFCRCTKLQSINIPNGVETLGNQCFYQCKSLQSINIPNTVTTLGNQCFYDCEGLKSLVLQKGIETIGEECFNSCAFNSLNIPSTISNIGRNAFSNIGMEKIIFNWDNENDILQYSDNWDLYNSWPSVNTQISIPYGTTQLYIDAQYPEEKLVEQPPEEEEYVVTKAIRIVWDDNNNANNLRPNSVTATLQQNNTTYRTFSLTNEIEYYLIVYSLPRKINNQVVTYTWLIEGVPSYQIASQTVYGDVTTIVLKEFNEPIIGGKD